METYKVAATRRTATGKGPNRRLRSENQIPAVSYGGGLPATQLAVSPKSVIGVLTSERGQNTLVELEVEGGERQLVLIADYQYHPVTRQLLHADFIHVSEDEDVDVEVPLEVTGKPKGVVMGGILRQVFRKLPLRCKPRAIPVKLTHDITELDVEGHIAVSELALPEGVSVRLPPNQTLILIADDKRRKAEEAAAAAEAPAADAKKKK